MEWTIDESLSGKEAGEIGNKLDAFNAQQTGCDDEQSLRLAARNTDGQLLGGLTGVTGMEWLYIHILWLEESHRNQGIGSKLVEAAEKIAIDRGCRCGCLMTFSFQAREFYERHGYEIYGDLDDYPAGHTLHFMKKVLGTGQPDH